MRQSPTSVTRCDASSAGAGVSDSVFVYPHCLVMRELSPLRWTWKRLPHGKIEFVHPRIAEPDPRPLVSLPGTGGSLLERRDQRREHVTRGAERGSGARQRFDR